MTLKQQSEREIAYRIFKFYKATGVFPADKTPLESYKLLAKYNYFIACNLDKQTINALTEIVNVLKREKILIVYGDFLLETLKFGLKSFNNTNIDIVYVDCIIENIDETLSNVFSTSNIKKNTTIYLIDNIEEANKKSLDLLVKVKEDIENSNKLAICCASSLDGLNSDFKAKFKRIQLGTVISNDNNIRKLIYLLFNNDDKELVYNTLINMEMSYEYLFSMIAYNLPVFFMDNPEKFTNNLYAISYANSQLHKIDDRLLIIYLTYAIQTTKNKRVIRFPPKNVDKTLFIKKNIAKISHVKDIRKSNNNTKKSVNISSNKEPVKTNKPNIKRGLAKYVK